jgi:membrane protein implicated in regulation of membrane protease activity
MENNTELSDSPIISAKKVTFWDMALAIIIAPITSFFIILLLTNVINFISREDWDLPIIWPPELFIAGLIGGFIGGIITFWEIRMVQNNKRDLIPGKLFSPDLLYIGGLAVLTYFLEILSESLLLQGLLFLLEIAWFIVLGWNISKLSLERPKKEEKNKTEDEID